MPINIVCLFFFGVCWGLTIPLTKIAVDAGHHPLGLIFWQLLIGGVVLGGYLLANRETVSLSARSIRYFLLIAVIGTLVPNTFSLLAIQQLPAGIMAIVISTVPMVSLAIAVLARIEAFSWVRSLGVLIGVCALMLIALPDASLPDPTKAPWLLVAMIAPLCYAVEGNFVAVRSPPDLSPIATLFGASCVGVIVLLPIVWPLGMGVSLTTRWDVSHWAILASAVGHVVAYAGYLWMLRRAGAVFTSQVAYIVTLTGIAGSLLLLGERYGLTAWIAILLMFVAMSLVKPLQRDA